MLNLHSDVDLGLVEVTEGKAFLLAPTEQHLGCFPTCGGRQNLLGAAEEVPVRAEGFP